MKIKSKEFKYFLIEVLTILCYAGLGISGFTKHYVWMIFFILGGAYGMTLIKSNKFEEGFEDASSMFREERGWDDELLEIGEE